MVISQGSAGFSGPPEIVPSLETNDDKSPDPGLERGVGVAGRDLWNYLQPHLVAHKGPTIPSTGWVRQLITLPQLRELDWNLTWLADHPFSDSQPRDISALIVQVTGDVAPTPCTRCRDGRGPFTSCVMVSTKAHSGPLTAIFSCANCFYHYGQTHCTHKDWGVTRAKSTLQYGGGHPGLPAKPSAPKVEFESDDRLGQNIPDMSAIGGDETMEDMDDLTADTPPTIGSVSTGIKEAEPGRPYGMWPGKNKARPSKPGTTIDRPSRYQRRPCIHVWRIAPRWLPTGSNNPS